MGISAQSLRAAAATVLIAMAALWSPLAGQTASTEPATTAASRPALFDTEAEPRLMPIAPPASVEEALRYTDEERIVLDDVNLRDGSLNTPALYVLLRRAEMLPKDRKILTEADQPNIKNLWREPKRWRYRLVRVEGKFLALEDYTPHATPTRWWGARPVHALYLVETQTGESRRLIIMLTRKPARPMRVGKPVQLAGILYKLARLPKHRKDAETAELVDFPVLVAGAVFDAGTGGAGIGLPPQVMVTILVVVLLLVVFILVRVRLGRRATPASGYKPLRLEPPAEGSDAGEDDTVDEELRRQVEAFEQGRADRAGKDDADNQTDCR